MAQPSTTLPARRVTPYVVLITGSILSLAAGLIVFLATEAQHRVRAQKQALRVTQGMRAQVDAQEAFLRAAAALVAVSDSSSRQSFQSFVEIASPSRRLLGIEAVGVASRVTLSGREGLQTSIRRAGQPRFEIRPPGARLEYVVAVQVEAVDYRHRELLGYDLFADPRLREALNTAIESGEPTASLQVPIVPDSTDAALPTVFFFVAPVYEGGTLPATVTLRRARLMGFVFSAMRAEALFATLSQGDGHVRISEPRVLGPEAVVYDSGPDLTGWAFAWGSLRLQRDIAVAGRAWSLEFIDPAAALELLPAPAVVGLGLGLSYLLFRITRFQLRARLAAERAASALRASEEALRASEAEAIAANKAKDAFLATLSHELRTPLNAILGWTSMLRSGKVDAARQARAFEVVERNARVQARLIEDLFDVSRIISGKFVVDRKLMVLEPVLHAAVESVRLAAEEKQVRLVYDGHDSASNAVVLADPARVQQVVNNLLSNAIKFTPPGGSASLHVRRSDDWVEMSVVDTGVGIDPRFLPHVFERFRQADSTTTRMFGGMGLGLAIVHHLVQVHGGTVEAQSEGIGKGATFLVRFPLAARARSVGDVDSAEGAAEPIALDAVPDETTPPTAEDTGPASPLVVER